MNASVRASCLSVFSALLFLGSQGCVKSKVTVFVNPDGSGHLVVSRLFGRQAVETFEMQRREMEMNEMLEREGMEEMKAEMKRDPFYDEKMLKGEAKAYGSGVKLVKSRRIDMDGGRGSIAVYSFKDINDVYVSTDVNRFNQMMYGGMPDMGEDDDEDDGGRGGRRGKAGIEFSFQTGMVSALKVLLPGFEAADGEDGEEGIVSNSSGEDDDNDGAAEDVEMMAEWFDPGAMAYSMPVGFNYQYAQRYAGNAMVQGLAVGVEIAVNGKVVASSASHTNASNGSRIVLLDVDSSRPDKKGGKSERNNDLYNYYDFGRLMSGLSKVPGTIIETNREVVVTFK